jgi:translation initiation factor IF-2
LPRVAALALVALPLLVLGGWLILRSYAVPLLQLSSASETVTGPTLDAPSLLQELHTARALAEPERAPAVAAAANEVDALTAEQSAARAAQYDAWLRSQRLTRIPQAPPEPPARVEPQAPAAQPEPPTQPSAEPVPAPPPAPPENSEPQNPDLIKPDTGF